MFAALTGSWGLTSGLLQRPGAHKALRRLPESRSRGAFSPRQVGPKGNSRPQVRGGSFERVMNLRRCLPILVWVFCLACFQPSQAGDISKVVNAPIQSGCLPPSDTEFRVGLPGWLAGESGEFGIRGTTTDLDISFGDIFKRLDMIAAGSLYYRYHRWEFFADGLYLRISEDAQLRGILFGSGHIAIKSAFAEGFVGYRLIHCQQGYLSLFAGGRYNYISGDFRLIGTRLRGRSRFGEQGWVDPVVGVSGRVHLWNPLSFWAKGDIGGFGAASDFAWQLQGGLGVQITHLIYSDIGWRYLQNDYTSGDFTDKTHLNGPYIETGFTF